MKTRLAAILLCAGVSSRMGAFKPLLALGKWTLLEQAVSTVRSAEKIHVVIGHRAEELAPLVEKSGAEAVRNPGYEQGMFSSVCAGVRSLPSDIGAFFLLPVDIALVRPATYMRLSAAWKKNPDRILHPTFLGRRGHPPLIPSDLIPSILESAGERGLRGVLESHEHRATEVAVADENILLDVDRPEDYETAKRRLGRFADPSPSECEAILTQVFPAAEEVAAHGRLVQKAAVALCRALNRFGAEIDEKRVAAAALLHDLAKGVPDHARVGGKMLQELGFGPVGAIVADHTDLPEKEMQAPKESALVYLADKLVSGERFVSLQSRFDTALFRHGNDPEAKAAVERRKAAAMAVKQMVEKSAGRSLEKILMEAGIRFDAGVR